MLVLVLSSILAVFVPDAALSQRLEFEEFHTWSDLATIYDFTERFRYDGDYGIRGFLTDSNWTLVYLRPSVRYMDRAWLALHGGAALFYNFIDQGEDLPEIRPWVGGRLSGPRPGGFLISNYFRLELRAFHFKEDSKWDTVFRGRWQLQVTSPRFRIGSAEEFYALTSIEPFFHIGSSLPDYFGDRFRYNFGMGKNVNQALRIELNYLFHRIRIEDEDGRLDADDHVVRVRLFYRFS